MHHLLQRCSRTAHFFLKPSQFSYILVSRLPTSTASDISMGYIGIFHLFANNNRQKSSQHRIRTIRRRRNNFTHTQKFFYLHLLSQSSRLTHQRKQWHAGRGRRKRVREEEEGTRSVIMLPLKLYQSLYKLSKESFVFFHFTYLSV